MTPQEMASVQWRWVTQKANQDGDFMYEPRRGGGRLDKILLAPADMRWRYSQASYFGEVNTYFHLDKIAAYVDGLLRQLGAPSLPRSLL
jgi:hypothetical protein